MVDLNHCKKIVFLILFRFFFDFLKTFFIFFFHIWDLFLNPDINCVYFRLNEHLPWLYFYIMNTERTPGVNALHM